jgi:hypothetical protein
MRDCIVVVSYAELDNLCLTKGWGHLVGTSQVPTNPPPALMGHVVLAPNPMMVHGAKYVAVADDSYDVNSYAYGYSPRLKSAVYYYMLVHTSYPDRNRYQHNLSDVLRPESWGWYNDLALSEVPSYMVADALPVLLRNSAQHIFHENAIDVISELLVDDTLLDSYQLRVDIMLESKTNTWIQKYLPR